MVEPTHLKICSSKWESSPNRGENKKCLKPPSSIYIYMKFYSPEVWFIENTSTDFKMMEDFSRLCWANCWTPFIKSTSGHQHNGRELVYSQVRKWSTIHQPWTTVKLRVLEIKNQTLKTFQSRHQSVTQVTQNDSWFVWKQHETNKVLKRCFFFNGQAKSFRFSLSCLDWFHPS